MNEAIEELLDSPVGRRMVEAYHDAWMGHIGLASAEEAGIAAALRVALSDTCQTCGGIGIGPPFDAPEGTCFDCDNGKVPSALWTRKMVDDHVVSIMGDLMTDAYKLIEREKESHRAQWAAEVAGWLRHIDRLDDIPGAAIAFPAYNPLWDAATEIERWGKER